MTNRAHDLKHHVKEVNPERLFEHLDESIDDEDSCAVEIDKYRQDKANQDECDEKYITINLKLDFWNAGFWTRASGCEYEI